MTRHVRFIKKARTEFKKGINAVLGSVFLGCHISCSPSRTGAAFGEEVIRTKQCVVLEKYQNHSDISLSKISDYDRSHFISLGDLHYSSSVACATTGNRAGNRPHSKNRRESLSRYLISPSKKSRHPPLLHSKLHQCDQRNFPQIPDTLDVHRTRGTQLHHHLGR